MAFQKSLPHHDLYPGLPDMQDDEDDEILRGVKMLSLITAQEEQERRERLNQELSLSGKLSRSSLTLQESSSLPELIGSMATESSSGTVERSGAKTAMTSQIARPRPHAGRSAQGSESGFSAVQGTVTGAPSRTVVPPPLPAARPNARSRLQTDPIRIPSPPRTAQRNRMEFPARSRDASSNRSHSLSPPFHRTNLASYSIPDDIPGQSSVSGSNHDAPLICLSPPSTRPGRVDDFDLKSLDPLQHRNSSVTKTGANPAPQNLCRPSADSKVFAYRNSPVPYPLDGSQMPFSPFVGGNDVVGGYPVIGFMPWVTNNPCSPSSPGFPSTWLDDLGGSDPAGSSGAAEQADRSQRSGATGHSAASDLMDFSTDGGSHDLDPVYMDLADFDPLYTVDSKAWNYKQHFNSNELFGKPGKTPQQSAVIVSSATYPTVPARSSAPLPDVVAQSSVSRLASVEELQDPFSVEDLMVCLERKRQNHAREQEIDAGSERAQMIDNASAAPRRKVKTRAVERLTFFNHFGAHD